MTYCLTQDEYDALKEDTSHDALKIMEEKFDDLYTLISLSRIHTYDKHDRLFEKFVAIELDVDDMPEWLSELIERKQGK